ncbi:low choriolytic enzyme isoform X2 [Anabrus simplex]
MPYVIDDYFLPEQKEIIQDVIDEFNTKSCVRMRPYRHGDRDYVLIQRSFLKSSSQIGHKGGAQVVNLMNCCGKRGQINHELLHAWGFHHQHSVVGREKYIRINWENIIEENIKNFLKQDSDDFGLPYDYDSVMHYDRFAFSKNNKPTIEPLVEGVEIGQREGFSEMDIIKLNMLYDCPFVFKNSTNSEIKRTDR